MPATSTATPRDEVLDVAARLFTTKGFAATSTREIAERVGIRQASLYYHFSGKDEMLSALLGETVRPSQEKVKQIDDDVPPESFETALYLLALVDIHTLAEVPHNVGMLYQLPDVVSAGDGAVYAEFQHARAELAAAYADFGSRLAARTGAAVSASGLGSMLIGLVEGVITMRTEGITIQDSHTHEIAAGCLRLCGCTQERIDAARARAEELRPRYLTVRS